MHSLAQSGTDPQDVFLYGRNSTDDQAEAGTIKNQQDFLRSFVALYDLNVVGEYWDEGVSGTVPLGHRPAGRQLVDVLQAHTGAAVLVYRLDRLGRTLRTLLEAHDNLEAAGVTIKSATEPFDTGTAIGKFLFQLLASLAELERSTITERMALGKSRVAKAGKWVGGPIPFGYDVDADGVLIPSERLIEQLGLTEAEAARQLFTNIANGSSTVAEALRLSSLGVPCVWRYPDGKTITVGKGIWRSTRLCWMLRNTTYIGRRTFNSKAGPVECGAPPLIDEETFAEVSQQLLSNRKLSKKNSTRTYLLRGLVTCDPSRGGCGFTFVGATATREGWEHRFYRCQTYGRKDRGADIPNCHASVLPADELEALIWADCAYWLRHPDEGLSAAQAELRARLSKAPSLDSERQRLNELIAEKDEERERVMILYRRKRMTLEQAEKDLDTIAKETSQLKAMLDAIRAQDDLTRAFETQYTEAATLLAKLGAEVDEIEEKNDLERKRKVIELLVAEVRAKPKGRGINGRVSVTYRFGRPSLPVISASSEKNARLRVVDSFQLTGTSWYPFS